MPDIDVTDVLLGTDTAMAFDVIRHKETISDKGRQSSTDETFHVFGMIEPKDTAIGGNEVTRDIDKMFREAALIIHTSFRLRAVGPGYQPDTVVFNGDRYVVTLVNNWSPYGAGFVYAEAASQETQDAPP